MEKVDKKANQRIQEPMWLHSGFGSNTWRIVGCIHPLWGHAGCRSRNPLRTGLGGGAFIANSMVTQGAASAGAPKQLAQVRIGN